MKLIRAGDWVLGVGSWELGWPPIVVGGVLNLSYLTSTSHLYPYPYICQILPKLAVSFGAASLSTLPFVSYCRQRRPSSFLLSYCPHPNP